MTLSLHPASQDRSPLRLQIYDLAVAAVAPLVAFWLRDDGNLFSGELLLSVAIYSTVAFVCTVLSVIYFRVSAILITYFSAHDAMRIVKAAVISSISTASLLFFVTRLDNVPRSIPLLHAILLIAFMIASRFALAYYRQRQPQISSRQLPSAAKETILVVGANKLAWFYIRMVDSLAHEQRRIIAVLDSDRSLLGRSLSGYSIVGSPQQLGRFIDDYAEHGVFITSVLVAGPRGDSQSRIWTRMQADCDARSIKLDSIADRLDLPVENGLVTQADGEPGQAAAALYAIDPRPVWRYKRIFDIAFAVFAGIALLPAALVVAVIVLLEFGTPVLFWQERLGRGGAPIFVYKFRTLRPPFDRRGRPIPDDERSSRIGRFLRATRLDELPQLLNLIAGDMSLVGPRPLLPVDQPESAEVRLSVRPGITGWAQVHGGKLIGIDEKGALDEWYIRNASMWLDIKIILLTVRSVFTGDSKNDAVIAQAFDTPEPEAGRDTPEAPQPKV